VPVVGNVICGGAEKVIYKADWSALDQHGRPRDMQPGESVVDELDVADLVSEREHRYIFPRPRMGFVSFRVLPDPEHKSAGLFDAGRQIPTGQSETARLVAPHGPGRLIVRTTATNRAVLEARAGDRKLGRIELNPKAGWIEASVDLPADLPSPFDLTLTPVEGEWIDHHLWIVEGTPRSAVAHESRGE
jgi:hypothetical protein